MQFRSWASGFHIWLTTPPTDSLRPVNPNNAWDLRITAAAGTKFAVPSSSGTITTHASYCVSHYSLMTGVYDPRAFILHAASHRQTFVHCEWFSTAATRRCLDRVSVPVWLVVLSDQLPVIALVSRYLTNKLIGREPILKRQPKPPLIRRSHGVLISLSKGYPPLQGR